MMTTERPTKLEGLLPLCLRLEHRRDPGCPDADGDGVTDRVGGTEDKEDERDFSHSLPSPGPTTHALHGRWSLQCFFRDGVSTEGREVPMTAMFQR